MIAQELYTELNSDCPELMWSDFLSLGRIAGAKFQEPNDIIEGADSFETQCRKWLRFPFTEEPLSPEQENYVADLNSTLTRKRLEAAKGLGRLGQAHFRVVMSLTTTLFELQSGPQLHIAIMESLQALAAAFSPTIEVLISLFKSEENQVKAVAISTTSLFGKPAIPHLMKALERDFQKNEICSTLRKMKASDVVPSIAEAIKQEHEVATASYLSVLSHFKEEAAPAVPAIENLLRHGSSVYYSNASTALFDIGLPSLDAFSRLLALENKDLLLHVTDVVKELTKIEGAQTKELVPRLLELLSAQDKTVRNRAAECIYNVGEGAVEWLQDINEALKRGDPNTCVNLGRALPKMGAFAFIHILENLEHENEHVRQAAANALYQMQMHEKLLDGEDVLYRILNEKKYPKILSNIVRFVGNLGENGAFAIEPLEELVYEEGDISHEAANAIGRIGRAAIDTAQTIAEAFRTRTHKDTYSHVLTKIGATEALGQLLDEELDNSEHMLIEALVNLGKDAVSALDSVVRAFRRCIAQGRGPLPDIIRIFGNVGTSAAPHVNLLFEAYATSKAREFESRPREREEVLKALAKIESPGSSGLFDQLLAYLKEQPELQQEAQEWMEVHIDGYKPPVLHILPPEENLKKPIQSKGVGQTAKKHNLGDVYEESKSTWRENGWGELTWHFFLNIVDLAGYDYKSPTKKLTNEESNELAGRLQEWKTGISQGWLQLIQSKSHPLLMEKERNFTNLDFTGANFTGVNLSKGNFYEANFCNAILYETNLSGSYLKTTNFSGADLRWANLCETTIVGANFENAIIQNAYLDKAAITGEQPWTQEQIHAWRDRGGRFTDDVAFSFTSFGYQPFPAELVEELDTLIYNRYRNKSEDPQQVQERVREINAELQRHNRPKAGDVVAEARLLEIIGKGAFGAVWKAETIEGGHPRAVKIFDSDRLADGLAVHLFRRGVRAMVHLKEKMTANPLTPNTIVHIQEFEQHQLAFTMDMVPDGDLSKGYIAGKEESKKIALFTHIANAVGYGHKHNVVHRDIKPQNIVMKGDIPILTDFDIADMEFAKTLSRRSVGGAFVYSAPEQLSGECDKLEYRSDIYSLGRMLHFFLIEKDPPSLFEPVPSLRDLDGHPPGLVKIIRKCTHVDVSKRYASVNELLRDLGKYDKPDEVGTESPDLPEDEAIKKALDYWRQAESYAEERRWESSIEAGEKAIEVLSSHNLGLKGDWKKQVLVWKAHTGDKEAAIQAGLRWFLGKPRSTVWVWVFWGFLGLLLGVPSLTAAGWQVYTSYRKEERAKHEDMRKQIARKQAQEKLLNDSINTMLDDRSTDQKKFWVELNNLRKDKKNLFEAQKRMAQLLLNLSGRSACQALIMLYQTVPKFDVSTFVRKHAKSTVHRLAEAPFENRIAKIPFEKWWITWSTNNLNCPSKVILGRINLKGAGLRKTQLIGAFFAEADLRIADFSKADLRISDFSKADLRGANLETANLNKAEFREAIYDKFTRWPKGFNPIKAGAKCTNCPVFRKSVTPTTRPVQPITKPTKASTRP